MNKALLAKSLFLFAFALNLSCADSGSDNKRDKFANPTNEVVEYSTYPSVCQGPTPQGYNIFRAWRSDATTNSGLNFTNIMKVDRNSIALTVTCQHGDNSASVTVRSNISVNANSIMIMSNDSQEVTTEASNSKITCRADLRSGMKIEYNFEGPCLKARAGNETIMMIPSPY